MTIHQIWIGDEPPRCLRLMMDRWQPMNPDADYRLWCLPSILHTFPDSEELLRQCHHPAQQADVARLFILERFGGLYLDADIQPIKPVSQWFTSDGVPFSQEERLVTVDKLYGHYPNALLQARAGDVLLRQAINNIRPTADVFRSTGPAYLTHIVKGNPEKHATVPFRKIIPMNHQEYHRDIVRTQSEVYAPYDPYASHVPYGSWLKGSYGRDDQETYLRFITSQ